MYLIGQGIDQHKIYKKTNSLIKLGGKSIKSQYSIKAVSDGDVVLHSISNAILGAIGAGDIGEYFKDTDKKNKKIDSLKIINFCLKKIKGYAIVNVDLTIQCEKIMLLDHKREIKDSLSKILKCKRVNVKATRFEQDADLIKCYCCMLIKSNK